MRSNPRPDFPKLWKMRIRPVWVRSCSDSSLVPRTLSRTQTVCRIWRRQEAGNFGLFIPTWEWLGHSQELLFAVKKPWKHILIFFNDCPLKSNRNTIRILLVIYQNHDELTCFAKFSENTCALRYYRWTFSEQYFLAG